MHNLLEDYLTKLSQNLGPLPAARREEELAEMRRHLLDAAVANQETGLSEDTAASNAVEQFGTPETLASTLVSAWHREDQRENKWSFWKASATMIALTLISTYLVSKPLNALLNSNTYRAHPWVVSVSVILLYGTIIALSGWITGLTFPKRAVTGVVFGLVMVYGFLICKMVYIDYPRGLSFYVYGFVWYPLLCLVFGSVAAFASRAASRRRLRYPAATRN